MGRPAEGWPTDGGAGLESGLGSTVLALGCAGEDADVGWGDPPEGTPDGGDAGSSACQGNGSRGSPGGADSGMTGL
ncbi:hypothetical protein GCM10025331_17760 [Actinoplanes utahensis]|nr:hypothetical protein Aut01nite_24960 [Actinoplanes utahensis]